MGYGTIQLQLTNDFSEKGKGSEEGSDTLSVYFSPLPSLDQVKAKKGNDYRTITKHGEVIRGSTPLDVLNKATEYTGLQ